jgi:methionyl aminopeptidase
MTVLESILDILAAMTVEGATGKQLEAQAANLMKVFKVEPAFLGYKPNGFKGNAYPSVMCVSINEEVIHGIPDERPFEDGDVIKLDIGTKDTEGQYDDGATTILIGKGSGIARRLLKATQEALQAGIHMAKPGNTTHDIGKAIEAVAKREELAVIHGYGGHGIGTELHMEPFIPNEVTYHMEKREDWKPMGHPDRPSNRSDYHAIVPDIAPVKLEKGMRIAIEPMFATKRGDTKIGSDGWLIRLAGGGLAAHFEKTITV